LEALAAVAAFLGGAGAVLGAAPWRDEAARSVLVAAAPDALAALLFVRAAMGGKDSSGSR
jgi:hypothetical protein